MLTSLAVPDDGPINAEVLDLLSFDFSSLFTFGCRSHILGANLNILGKHGLSRGDVNDHWSHNHI